jgi:hypothetical protein
MNKKYLTISIIGLIILLVIFFFPKQNNIWNDSFVARTAKEYKNMDCTCIGFTKPKPGFSRSDTQVKMCYGIPIKCVYSCKKEINNQWTNVSCDEVN